MHMSNYDIYDDGQIPIESRTISIGFRSIPTSATPGMCSEFKELFTLDYVSHSKIAPLPRETVQIDKLTNTFLPYNHHGLYVKKRPRDFPINKAYNN